MALPVTDRLARRRGQACGRPWRQRALLTVVVEKFVVVRGRSARTCARRQRPAVHRIVRGGATVAGGRRTEVTASQRTHREHLSVAGIEYDIDLAAVPVDGRDNVAAAHPGRASNRTQAHRRNDGRDFVGRQKIGRHRLRLEGRCSHRNRECRKDQCVFHLAPPTEATSIPVSERAARLGRRYGGISAALHQACEFFDLAFDGGKRRDQPHQHLVGTDRHVIAGKRFRPNVIGGPGCLQFRIQRLRQQCEDDIGVDRPHDRERRKRAGRPPADPPWHWRGAQA
jgi:hypothetical protein